MTKANQALITAIRNTAEKLKDTASYQWGHMGSCNCGFLAQEITHLNKSQIHQRAMRGHGDWNEQLNDYCPTSGLPMDELISNMLEFGLDTNDLKQLEKLSDHKILQALPQENKWLKHNKRDDVVLYFNTWADLLENELIEKISINDLKEKSVPNLVS